MGLKNKSALYAFFLVFFSFATVPGQSSGTSLSSREIPTFEVIDAPISSVIQRLAKLHRVPIGLELITPGINVRENKLINIKLERTSVRDILDAVIQVDSRYEWAEVDGVINVFPKQQKNPLLETVVESFQVDGERADFALSTLMELPAVKNELQKRGLAIRTAIDNVNDIPKPMARSFHLSRSTIRQILNKLMQEGDRYYWVFLVYGDRHQYLHIAL